LTIFNNGVSSLIDDNFYQKELSREFNREKLFRPRHEEDLLNARKGEWMTSMRLTGATFGSVTFNEEVSFRWHL
jgi:hypothetical protein